MMVPAAGKIDFWSRESTVRVPRRVVTAAAGRALIEARLDTACEAPIGHRVIWMMVEPDRAR